jgi:SAM-dependent methyltransferase
MMRHAGALTPSPWVTRFASMIAAGGEVLDFACGSGRHTRWLASKGFRVEAADRDAVALELLIGVPHVMTRETDLEEGAWPYAGRHFDGIVVTNYLFRPRLPLLLTALNPGGVLIYETFMVGNERFGKPSNPDFLLRSHELFERVADACTVLAYEQGEVAEPKPAVIQRICAIKGHNPSLHLP